MAEMASPEQGPPIGSVRAPDPQVGDGESTRGRSRARHQCAWFVGFIYVYEVRSTEASGGRQDS